MYSLFNFHGPPRFHNAIFCELCNYSSQSTLYSVRSDFVNVNYMMYNASEQYIMSVPTLFIPSMAFLVSSFSAHWFMFEHRITRYWIRKTQ